MVIMNVGNDQVDVFLSNNAIQEIPGSDGLLQTAVLMAVALR